MTGKSFNFSAGPGVMPRSVLETVQGEMLDFLGSGSCLMELSHRSKAFETVLSDAEKDLRTLLEIPEDYGVLFMQGGATAQVCP
jgi:phosphoserine aminotransferase